MLPLAPQGNGASQDPARSEQRRKAIQQQLMLLIHAYKCKLKSAEDPEVGADRRLAQERKRRP
jgi:hypothetical protein